MNENSEYKKSGGGNRSSEAEMRKAARRKYAEKVWQSGHYDVGPLGPTPAQAGMLLRRGWFGRLREGFGRMSK